MWGQWQMRWHVAEPDRIVRRRTASRGGLQWVQDRQRIRNGGRMSEPRDPRGVL